MKFLTTIGSRSFTQKKRLLVYKQDFNNYFILYLNVCDWCENVFQNIGEIEISCLKSFQNCEIPVSYTHLDVYKRQL